MLTAEVIKWTQFKGINKLKVRTNSIRIETHEFYRNLGFKEIKEQKIFDLNL